MSSSPRLDELRATLALASPLILANLTQQAIQGTDVLMMGRLGAKPLAGAILALNLTFTLNLLILGILIATSPMMARALGQRKNAVRDVRRTFRAGLWLLVLAMPPYWLILWNVGAIMRAFGQNAELAAIGETFLRAYMWATAPWLLFQLLRNFVSALERPAAVLWISVAGIAFNALLSWSLIFGHLGSPALGIVGGGIGSSIAWLAMCIALVVVVATDRHFSRFHLFGRFWRLDGERLRVMMRLGWPIGATMALEMGVFALAAYLMGFIGTEAVAAHAIALQIAALTFMVPMGLGQAVTVRVGLALGRGDRAAIARAGWTAWLLGVGFMGLMAVAMWAVPRTLVTLFIAATPGNARVIDLGVSFLTVAAIFQVVDGAQVVGAGMLRGLHDTRVPMLFALLGYWGIGIGVGAWLAFGVGWQGVGIWTGLALGLAIVAVLMVTRWTRRGSLGLERAVAAPEAGLQPAI